MMLKDISGQKGTLTQFWCLIIIICKVQESNRSFKYIIILVTIKVCSRDRFFHRKICCGFNCKNSRWYLRISATDFNYVAFVFCHCLDVEYHISMGLICVSVTQSIIRRDSHQSSDRRKNGMKIQLRFPADSNVESRWKNYVPLLCHFQLGNTSLI